MSIGGFWASAGQRENPVVLRCVPVLTQLYPRGTAGDVEQPLDVSVQRVARNFVQRYGLLKLRWLLVKLEAEDVNGSHLADVLGVSRQRVWQWASIFGRRTSGYRVNDTVRAMLSAGGRDRAYGVSGRAPEAETRSEAISGAGTSDG